MCAASAHALYVCTPWKAEHNAEERVDSKLCRIQREEGAHGYATLGRSLLRHNTPPSILALSAWSATCTAEGVRYDPSTPVKLCSSPRDVQACTAPRHVGICAPDRLFQYDGHTDTRWVTRPTRRARGARGRGRMRGEHAKKCGVLGAPKRAT